jgi:hypothetical protein
MKLLFHVGCAVIHFEYRKVGLGVKRVKGKLVQTRKFTCFGKTKLLDLENEPLVIHSLLIILFLVLFINKRENLCNDYW